MLIFQKAMYRRLFLEQEEHSGQLNKHVTGINHFHALASRVRRSTIVTAVINFKICNRPRRQCQLRP